MAFTRATIRNLAKDSGVEIPKELEDALITEHLTARNAYAEEQVKANQTTPNESNVKDSEEYKSLKKSFDDYKADVEAKETKAKKVAAYRDILKDSTLSEKGVEKAIKYADWEKIELDSDGKLKCASDLIKAAKAEWAEYVTTTTTTGAKTSTPPANSGSAKLTKEDIYKKDDKGRYIMSTSERQKALAENPHLMN
jgi:hypothetical protein